jgi:hypothetical protein
MCVWCAVLPPACGTTACVCAGGTTACVCGTTAAPCIPCICTGLWPTVNTSCYSLTWYQMLRLLSRSRTLAAPCSRSSPSSRPPPPPPRPAAAAVALPRPAAAAPAVVARCDRPPPLPSTGRAANLDRPSSPSSAAWPRPTPPALPCLARPTPPGDLVGDLVDPDPDPSARYYRLERYYRLVRYYRLLLPLPLPCNPTPRRPRTPCSGSTARVL